MIWANHRSIGIKKKQTHGIRRALRYKVPQNGTFGILSDTPRSVKQSVSVDFVQIFRISQGYIICCRIALILLRLLLFAFVCSTFVLFFNFSALLRAGFPIYFLHNLKSFFMCILTIRFAFLVYCGNKIKKISTQKCWKKFRLFQSVFAQSGIKIEASAPIISPLFPVWNFKIQPFSPAEFSFYRTAQTWRWFCRFGIKNGHAEHFSAWPFLFVVFLL